VSDTTRDSVHDGDDDHPGDRTGNRTEANRDRTTDPAPDRHDRVTAHPTPGRGNSLHRWYRHRNPLRVMVNYAVVLLARVSPSLRLKRFLFRRLGMTVGERVAWGLESTPDVFWPELITVEDDALVGYDATILCHEFLRDEYRTGEVVVGEGAMIGAGAIVLPGVRVGEGARVAANSLVTEDVPSGTTAAGVPAAVVSSTAESGGTIDSEKTAESGKTAGSGTNSDGSSDRRT